MANNTKRPNSGFTIVELIVVVSIIAVMTALIVPNITPKYTTAAKTTAVKIDDFLAKGRIRQMSRSEIVEVRFYYEKDKGIYGVYAQGGNAQPPQRLSGPAVKFCDKNGLAIANQPSSSDPIIITFVRSTGALGQVTSTNGGFYEVKSTPDNVTTTSIYVTARTRVSGITIYNLTGRHKTLL